MADKPKSFNQRLSEAQRQVGGAKPRSSTSPSKLPEVSSFGSSAKMSAAEKPQDALGWLTDMLSRPLYAVTNTIDNAMDTGAAINKRVANGEGLGAVAEEFGKGASANSFARGLFSTDKADKHLTSELIEKGTDTVGQVLRKGGVRNDPEYEDVEDNVNPILKGVAGFVGDVTLDPLTYVPGAAIASVGKKLLAGGKGALDIAKGGTAVTKATLDTEKATRAAESVVDGVVTKSSGIRTPDVPEGTGKELELHSSAPARQSDGFVPEREESFLRNLDISMSKRADKIMKSATATPKAGSIAKGLKQYTTAMEAKVGLSATKLPQAMKPLDFAPWVNDSIRAFKSGEKLPLTAYPKVSIGGVDTPLPVALSKAVQGDKVAIEDLKFWHANTYTPVYQKAAKKGQLVDGLLKPVTPVSKPAVDAAHLNQLEEDVADTAEELVRLSDPEELASEYALRSEQDAALGNPVDYTPESILEEAQRTAAEAAKAADDYRNTGQASVTVMTGIQNLQQAVMENRAAVEAALTPALTKALERFTNPETFDKTVRQLAAVLDNSLDLTTLKRLPSPTQKLLTEIGVPVDVIPLGIRKWKDTAATVPPAPTVAKAVERMGETYDSPIMETAAIGTKHAISHDIMKQTADYDFKSKTGTLRTDELYGDGWGLNHREANNFFQTNVFVPMMKHTATEAKNLHLFGRAAAEFKRSRVLPAMRLSERFYDEHGVPLTIGVGANRVPLGQSEVVDILESIDRAGMGTYMWNGGTAVPPTNFLDAAYIAATSGDREAIELALRQTSTRYLRSDGREVTFENRLVEPIFGRNQQPVDGDVLVQGLTELFVKASGSLKMQVSKNADALSKRGVDETYQMTDANLEFLEKTFADGSLGDMLRAIDDTDSRVLQSATQLGALKPSAATAKIAVDAFVPVGDKIVARTALGTQRIAERTTGKLDDVQRAGNENVQKGYDDLIDDEAVFDPSGKADDFGENIQKALNIGMVRKTRAIFDRSMNTGPMHEAMVASENMWRDLVGETTKKLNQINKVLASPGNELWQDAFRAVQHGELPSNPKIAGAADEIADIMDQMFGRAGERALIDNRFFANNASINHINSVFDFYKLPYLFDVEAAEAAAKLSGRPVMEEAAQQWKNWDIKDPAEFMNKAYTALAKINTDQTIVNQFEHMTRRIDGAVSKTPKAGYARVVDKTGKSLFARYMPNDRYYKQEILDQLHSVDNLMQERLDLGGDFGKFVNEGYRPLQNMWKTGMTIVNPTHHIRNGISDTTLTGLAEGWRALKPSTFHDAMQAVASHNSYTNFDAIAALQGEGILPNVGKAVAQTKHGEITAEGLYTAMANRGNLPKFRTLENLDDEFDQGSGLLARMESKIQHTKAIQVAGTVTEFRDHYSRLHHAIVYLQKHGKDAQFKTMDDLLDAASRQIRKWHPDGSDMTKYEQGFKLLVPFYSWQRKTIPLILESLLTQPARVMALPKAQYALAESMGVNPDSLSDPFPEDQMFPSYLTSQITGPAFKFDGKYYGINPGFASNDILNDYVGGDPSRTILGSVSPLVRMPFELATGAQVGTGARINDTSDYIDSNIPLVGAASRITGNSVTGSLINGKLDPQYQIAQGNKDPVAGPLMAFANWLTGAGITPYSQPNQINYAEIEERNRQGEQKGF